MMYDAQSAYHSIPVVPSYVPGQIAGVQMTSQGALAFGAPPCGTEEARKAPACIVWKLVPCPAVKSPHDVVPMGCDIIGPIPQILPNPLSSQTKRPGG